MSGARPEMAKLVGRKGEFNSMATSLENAKLRRGSTIMLSGEPGIGKTRLIDEFKSHASAKNITVLAGAAISSSAQPFHMFSKALEGLTTEPLFEDQEYASFTEIFAVNNAGMLMAKASSVEGGLDADIFAGMLSAVQNFIIDSFDQGTEVNAGLGRLEYGSMKILIEHGEHLFLTAVVNGNEHADMKTSIMQVLRGIEAEHSQLLSKWSGRMADIVPVQEEIGRLAAARFLVRRDLEGIKLDNERLRIADKVLDCIIGLAEKSPLVLLLEDLHWADESSLHVFGYLARNIDYLPVMMIGTSRPKESLALDRFMERLMGEELAIEIKLGKLSKADVSGMISDICPMNDFPQSFIDSLAERCGGTPLFVIEFLKHMTSEGSIQKRDGKWMLVSENYSIPDTIEGVIQTRLDRLSPEALVLAEYASCIGREFQTGTVMSMDFISDPDSALEQLQSSQIAVRQNGSTEFCHAMYQNFIYSTISPRWKGVYHRCIAEYLENTYLGRTEVVLYELARHFTDAKVSVKAINYSLLAAAKAESSFAIEQAIKFYEDALSFSAGHDRFAGSFDGVHERLGDLYALSGRHPEAISAYSLEFTKTCEPERRAQLKRKEAEVHIKVGDFQKAERELKTGVEALAGKRSVEEARILSVMGGMCDKTGDYDRGIALLKEGMDQAERLGDLTELAHAYHGLGGLYLSRSRFPEAIESLEKALSIRRGMGAEKDVSKTLNNLGIAHWYIGDLDKALDVLGESLQIKEKVGDKQGIATAYSNLGMIHRNKGELAVALSYHQRSLAMKRRMGDKYGIGNSLHNIGVTCEDMGDWAGAMAAHEEALTMRKLIGDKNGVANSYNSIGIIHNYMGQQTKALEYQRMSLEIATEIDYKRIIIHSRIGISTACLGIGTLDEAMEEAQKALDLAIAIGAKREEAMSHHAVGNVLRLRQDYSGAMAEFEKAESLLRSTDAKSTLAILLYDIGLLSVKMGVSEKADATLREALSIFESSGMRHWIGLCGKAMVEIGT